MANIKEIAINKPDKDVIERLEQLLEMAKTGELQSLCYAVSLPGYVTANGWVGMNKNNMAMVGELEVLKRDVMDSLVELRIDPMTGQVYE